MNYLPIRFWAAAFAAFVCVAPSATWAAPAAKKAAPAAKKAAPAAKKAAPAAKKAAPSAQSAPRSEGQLLAEINSACRELKLAGTEKSIPVLAALLTTKDLSHAARLALESMPYPAAGAALRDAVGKTSGRVRAGIIDSLGERREAASVAVIAPALADSDKDVAAAAAWRWARSAPPRRPSRCWPPARRPRANAARSSARDSCSALVISRGPATRRKLTGFSISCYRTGRATARSSLAPRSQTPSARRAPVRGDGARLP